MNRTEKNKGAKKGDYDFLATVFEWVFYSLPPRSDNSFIRNMYAFYMEKGGLSKKQLEALLKTVDYIGTEPPFARATLEAIIKKKKSRVKSDLPMPKPLYTQDSETKHKLEEVLAVAPAHKAALLYLEKISLNQPLSQSDRDSINRFHQLLCK